ncbi:hypothetical protein BDW02DRAFT_475888, partial [Decorospora gaudefroyi]
RRYYTTPTPTPSQSRIRRFNNRLPKFLHKYTNALSHAPVTHITSFLLLHELTAIIPLLGLAAYFHYVHWLPAWVGDGAWIEAGVERFGRYFRRKGWIGGEEVVDVGEMRGEGQERVWRVGEGGVRVVVEFATAYAIVKMFLVPRILFSVWATPAFARWTVVPGLRVLGLLFGSKRWKGGGGASTGAGTGAAVVPKRG